MYETFDHTADLGLRVRAADLPALFADAGRGLTSMLLEDIASVRETTAVEIVVPAEELEYLLFDWLKAILSRFEEDHLLLARFEVTLGDGGVRAVCHGEPMDPARHEPGHEVKAITYHGLRVERDGGGWLAEVIVDI
ncbi:MAG: archease [Gemmataceae bacterium]